MPTNKQKRKEAAKRKAEQQKAAKQPAQANMPAPPPAPIVIEQAGQARRPPEEIEPRRRNEPAADNNEQARPHSWATWLAVTNLIFAGCVAIATFWQGYTSHQQWTATDNQYKAMVQQLELMETDQRPWVEVDAPVPKTVIPKPGGLFCAITNHGKTPAYVTSLRAVALEAMRADPPDSIDANITTRLEQAKDIVSSDAEIVIAPGASYKFELEMPPITTDIRVREKMWPQYTTRFACRVLYRASRDSSRRTLTTEQWFADQSWDGKDDITRMLGYGKRSKMD